MLAVYHLLGFRDDKPTRFHDIIEVKKAQMNADAALLYKASNPALAEWFLKQIDYAHMVGRMEYQTAIRTGATESTLKSIHARTTYIDHIHANCAAEIESSWQLPTDEQAMADLLRSLERKAKGKEKDGINFLLASMGELDESKTDEWFGVHTYILDV